MRMLWVGVAVVSGGCATVQYRAEHGEQEARVVESKCTREGTSRTVTLIAEDAPSRFDYQGRHKRFSATAVLRPEGSPVTADLAYAEHPMHTEMVGEAFFKQFGKQVCVIFRGTGRYATAPEGGTTPLDPPLQRAFEFPLTIGSWCFDDCPAPP